MSAYLYPLWIMALVMCLPNKNSAAIYVRHTGHPDGIIDACVIIPMHKYRAYVCLCAERMRMDKKDNLQKSSQEPKYILIYGQKIEVSDEYWDTYTRTIDTFRRQKQRAKQCCCPQSKRLHCTMLCDDCKYWINPLYSSADLSLLDNIADDTQMPVDEQVVNRIIYREALALIEELMPDAAQIGQLRQDGVSWDDIAAVKDVLRQTLQYRLSKLQEQVEQVYPNLLD